MRLAEIENGIVVNVIEVDPLNPPAWAAGWPEAGEAGPAWGYDGETFTPPAAPPVTVPAQIRKLALVRVLRSVDLALQPLGEGPSAWDIIKPAMQADAGLWEDFELSVLLERDDDIWLEVGTMLEAIEGWPAEANADDLIDAVFIAAGPA